MKIKQEQEEVYVASKCLKSRVISWDAIINISLVPDMRGFTTEMEWDLQEAYVN
jgi:hypothetical protein